MDRWHLNQKLLQDVLLGILWPFFWSRQNLGVVFLDFRFFFVFRNWNIGTRDFGRCFRGAGFIQFVSLTPSWISFFFLEVFLELPFLGGFCFIWIRMSELLVVHRVLLVAIFTVLAHLAVVDFVRIHQKAFRSFARFDRYPQNVLLETFDLFFQTNIFNSKITFNKSTIAKLIKLFWNKVLYKLWHSQYVN